MLLLVLFACDNTAVPSDTGELTGDTGDCEQSLFYLDADGDGFGDDDTLDSACLPPQGSVSIGGDCDDASVDAYPGGWELCDGLDQDCDDVVDEDALDSATWYLDADGDGWGDPESGEEGLCESPGADRVLQGQDCDDTDPAVHPDAIEICDGVDNDCEELTPEAGMAHFVSGLGVETDYSARLRGTGGVHTEVLAQDGVLSICTGTWPLSLRVRANVDIVGIGSVTLDPDGQSAGLILRQDGLVFSASNLEIRDGEGVGVILGEFTAGGGIECSGQSAMHLEQVLVRDSQAGVGAGMWVDGCTVTADALELRDNQAGYYGGGVALTGGSLSVVQGAVHDNAADYGGGLAIVGYTQEAAATLESTLVQDNVAKTLGGGAVVEDASLHCTGSSGEVVGFLGNNSENEGGGVYMASGSSLTSQDCDWGSGASANKPEDVSSDPEKDYSNNEDFECDEEGCL